MKEIKDWTICDVIGHDDEWRNPQVAICFNCKAINARYYETD